MEYISTKNLSTQTIKDIEKLCQSNSFEITFDLIEASFKAYHLAYDNSRLVAFLLLNAIDLDEYEVCALTDKRYQNQGIFKELLAICKKHTPEGILNISLNHNAITFKPEKTKTFSEYIYSDLFLKLTKDRYVKINNEELAKEYYYQPGLKHFAIKTIINNRKITVAKANLLQTKDFCNLWGVEVKKPYRRNGYGLKIVSYAINNHFSKSDSPIVLHVESDNIPAVNLYHKLGFTELETIDNYII